MSSYKFTINQGSTWKLIVVWKDSTGAIVDITGYLAKIQFRKTAQEELVLYEMSTTNGRIVLDGPNGKLTCTATKEETSGFKFTEALFDVFLTSPGGESTRLFKGSIIIDPSITR